MFLTVHGMLHLLGYDHIEEEDEKIMREMVLSQGFEIGEDNALIIPEGCVLKMTVPTELVPYCPDDGELMTTNLRADDSFVEDEGWHRAAEGYSDFIRQHENCHMLYMELGVGLNTPGIIKYPFWQMTLENEKAVYVCLNKGEAFCLREIKDRSICIDGDIGEVLDCLTERGDT